MCGPIGTTPLADAPLAVQNIKKSEVEKVSFSIPKGKVFQLVPQIEGDGQDGGVGGLGEHLWRHCDGAGERMTRVMVTVVRVCIDSGEGVDR